MSVKFRREAFSVMLVSRFSFAWAVLNVLFAERRSPDPARRPLRRAD